MPQHPTALMFTAYGKDKSNPYYAKDFISHLLEKLRRRNTLNRNLRGILLENYSGNLKMWE